MPADYNALLQQYILLSQMLADGKLTSPSDYKKFTDVKSQIENPPADDIPALKDAVNGLDPKLQQQLRDVRSTLAQQGGAGKAEPNAAAPGAPAPGADGKITFDNLDDLAKYVGGQLVEAGARGGGEGGELSISATTAALSRGTQAQKTTGVLYQNLPTPEEYLDNWDRGFQAHLSGMRATGAISSEAADWAEGQSTMFYGQYVRAQLAGVLKGQPLFRVAGLNADNKLIGTRQGAYESGTTADQRQMDEQLHQTSSGSAQISDIALDSILRRSTPGSSVGTSARVGATRGGSGIAIDTHGTTDDLTQTLRDQQEAIVQRNNLAVVANLSPLDFLKDNMDAGKLNLLYEGQKGTRAASTQVAATEEPVRRVG